MQTLPVIDEDYRLARYKDEGMVVVTILDNRITYQRADQTAAAMFTVPVKLRTKMISNQSTPVTETRIYDAVGWTS